MISLYWCIDFCDCRATEQICQAVEKPSPESLTFRLHVAFLQTPDQRLKKAGNKKGRATTTTAEQVRGTWQEVAIHCQHLNVHGDRGGEKQEKGEEAHDKSK